MDHKRTAKTEVRLPEIGLGTWRYGGGIEPIRAAINLGAVFIDTAESYGTEGVVGQAIKGVRHEVFLATKLSPRHFRRSDVLKSADKSLEQLGTDYVDLYQLHWPNYTVAIAETMGAMEELVDTGKIRFIGVSNFSLRDLRMAQKAMTKHRIVANQVRYNLVDRTIESNLLPYCQSQEITIIAHSPFGGGFSSLTKADPQRTLDTVARRNHRTVPEVALNWCISKTGVVAIPKSDTVDHVKENCRASGWRLSAEDVDLLNTGLVFRRRGDAEINLRRIARYCSQKLGRNL